MLAAREGSPPLWQVGEVEWEIPAAVRADMCVPARVFADAELLDEIRADGSLEQLQNVATLPGIVDAALAMPDVHLGYGFPVGGAATEPADGSRRRSGVGLGAARQPRARKVPFDPDQSRALRLPRGCSIRAFERRHLLGRLEAQRARIAAPTQAHGH